MTNIYRNSSSPFGYDVGEEDRIDAYGVDHSNFSLRVHSMEQVLAQLIGQTGN